MGHITLFEIFCHVPQHIFRCPDFAVLLLHLQKHGDDFFELLQIIFGQHVALVMSPEGVVCAKIESDIPFFG